MNISRHTLLTQGLENGHILSPFNEALIQKQMHEENTVSENVTAGFTGCRMKLRSGTNIYHISKDHELAKKVFSRSFSPPRYLFGPVV